MKVEFWEDLVCSYCGIANGRVNEALRRFGHEDEVELIHRSFRLMPDFPEGESIGFREHLGSQGRTPAQVEEMGQFVEQMAQKDGLTSYSVLENKIGNTTLAHEFLAWAGDQGHGNEAWNLLFAAHFSERADLWSIDDLVPYAEKLGLNPDEARQALNSRSYRPQVENDHQEVLSFGANGVPFLVIDRKYAVSGAQRVGNILKALEQAWNERKAASA